MVRDPGGSLRQHMNWLPLFGGGNADTSYTVRIGIDDNQYYLIQSHSWFSIHEGHDNGNYTIRRLKGPEWETIYESPVMNPGYVRQDVLRIQQEWDTWLMEQLL